MSADGRRAVSASGDKTVKVWDLESGRELRTLAGYSGSVQGEAQEFEAQEFLDLAKQDAVRDGEKVLEAAFRKAA